MKIILIRHGLTEANEQRRYSLDTTGLSSAAYPDLDVLKKKIVQYSYAHVYASPLQRAVETASYLGLKDLILDDRLKEYNFGRFKGLTFAEVQCQYPVETEQWMKDDGFFYPPEGESSMQHFLRVSEFLDECVHKEEDCLVITHYGTITMALAWALGDFSLRRKFSPRNGALSIIEVLGDYRTIGAVNC